MPLILRERDKTSKERMDDADCSREKLFNTYRYFSKVNAAVSGWKYIYKKKIQPLLDKQKQNTLLDIGCGGGDIPIKLATWAAADSFNLQVTAIDTDQRAIEFARENNRSSTVDFKQCSSTDLVEAGARFDFVISNHLLHHLSDSELKKLLKESKVLSCKRVLFSDIERCDLAYYSFSVLTKPFFQDSFIREDGLASIKRSFTYKELRAFAPPQWALESLFPSHLLLIYNQ